MTSKFRWRSSTPIRYGRGEGPVVLEFLAEAGYFEYRLPGASPMMYDASSAEEMDQLKDRLEATFGSADDLRRGLGFIDRYATRGH